MEGGWRGGEFIFIFIFVRRSLTTAASLFFPHHLALTLLLSTTMVKSRKSTPAKTTTKRVAVPPTLDEIDVTVLDNGDERWRDEIAGKV